MRGRLVVAALVTLTGLAAGCGGASRASSTLATDLEAMHLEVALARAPDLVAAVEAAAEDARAADARGDTLAAADDATLARLYAQAALDEAARLEADDARLAAERETLEAEARLGELEAQRVTSQRELARLAAARTAREEGARSLARAEVDEARPARARHDSLSDAGELRTAATAIRDRARLLDAAATALGAAPSGEIDDLLTRSEAAQTPLEGVRLADRAHAAARARLAEARRARPGVDAARIASLLEAAESEGFHVVELARGTGLEVEGVFDGASTRPSRAGEGRLARLAALVASYPDGPVRVEIDSATSADVARLAAARAQAVVRALVAGGLDASRVSGAEPLPVGGTPSPSARVRVVLVAYAPVPPTSGGAIPTTTPAPSSPPSDVAGE